MDIIRLDGKNGSGLDAEIRVSDTEPAFAGHFPDNPILPGVVLIGWSVQLAARLLGRPLRLQTVRYAKFFSAAGPGAVLQVESDAIEPAPDGAGWTVLAHWRRAGEKIAEIQFVAVDPREGAPA